MKKIYFILAVVAVSFSGCTGNDSTYQKETAAQEEAQTRMVNSVPIPKLDTSLERANVAKRAEIFNKDAKISYIYLISYGKVMAFYTVKGKVSSLNSYITPMEKLVEYDGSNCSSIHSGECYTVQQPDIDGTYGENVKGIFFFDTNGVYVEWNSEYMLVDQPLKLLNPVEIIQIKE